MRPALTFLCIAAPLTADPVPPAMFHCIDPNLEVTVWAAAPMLRNPTNIDIDKDGRIWVAEGVNYRKHFDRQPEGDRIMVLEDTDKDGKADKSWPFVQEPFLRAPLGVAVIGNKVVVSMAPDLVVYTDKDGDLKFDPAKGDTREVLLTGFNGRNHDHSLHSVTVGPDGKWYFSCGNCGAKVTDKSGKMFRIASKQNVSWWPKDPARPDWDPNEIAGQKSDDGRVYVGGFIARMDPDGSNVEILAHNLRNSYENCVTSFGDIFASDNDDQPACRVFWVLEGGNYGFASADGQRTWLADRRPGQSIATATWRQEDPGVAPAGDVYGGGSPTGCVFYENGALGEKHEGTLLVCEPGRNVIFGYKPQPEGAGWKLERFDFLTTNKEGSFTGTDFTGGNKTAKAEDVKTLFRPSDIAVGPDGALYISDWHDPRVGGHADMDDALEGTIYRVAPKGFKPKVPKFDLATVKGAIEALKSPAVHVRAQGAEALRTLKQANLEQLNQAVRSTQGAHLARLAWHSKGNIQQFLNLGDEAISDLALVLLRVSRSPDGSPVHIRAPNRSERIDHVSRQKYYRWLREADFQTRWNHRATLEFAPRLLGWQAASPVLNDPTYAVDYFMACRDFNVREICAHMFSERTGFQKEAPLSWPDTLAKALWLLHPPELVPAFKTRALAAKLPVKTRLDALTAIGFNDTAEAAQAMLEVSEKLTASRPGEHNEPQRGGTSQPGASEARAQPRVSDEKKPEPQRGETNGGDSQADSRIRETALWWLLNRKDSTWKAHNLNTALKERGIFDPDKIQLLPMPLPEPVAPAFSIADAAKLAGDAKRGEVLSQKCYVCHRIGANGVEYGPDLSVWGRTQSTEVILRSLIEPDADIAHGFAGTEIVTTDGLTIAGLLVSDSDPAIIRSAGGVTQMVPKARIKSKTGLQRSLMMSTTRLGLTAQEAADVAAFLKAKK